MLVAENQRHATAGDLTDERPVVVPEEGLPMTAFEHYMLRDDRPSHPMHIVGRFDFTGEPPASLDAAFATQLAREPLLSATCGLGRRGPCWHAAPPPGVTFGPSPFDLKDDDGGLGFVPSLDPANGPLLQLRLWERPGGWSLGIAVHHAAADGLGILGFLERAFVRAAGLTPRRRRTSDPLAQLAIRGRIATSWRQWAETCRRLPPGLWGVLQYVHRRVVALDFAGSENAPAGPQVVSGTLAEAAIKAAIARSGVAGASVNDHLVARLVETLAAALPPTAREGRWIRLAVPWSLRTKSDRLLPACNRVSMVFVDRKPHGRLRGPRLLASVRDEIALIRRHELGHIFPLSLEAGRRIPFAMSRPIDGRRPQSTAVVSNVGSFFRRSPLAADDGRISIGPSRLTGWWMTPPVRPGTAVAIGTHRLGERRTIALRFDPMACTAEAAGGILADYLERLAR